MEAIFSTGGKQYRAKKGDLLQVELIDFPNKKTPVEIESVNALIQDKSIKLNPKAKVVLQLVKNFRRDKILVFKMKRRKGFRKTQSHRQNVSLVKVKEIQLV